MQNIRILTAGDSSLLIEFGDEISPDINRRIAATVELMREQHIEGVVDVIPAFCSLLVNYDPRVIRYEKLKKRMESMVRMDIKLGEGKRKIFEIPVLYGGEYGPDLGAIAEHAGISEEEVIRIHSSRDYLIYMLGFIAGFPYLGGMSKEIATPRLQSPRVKIPGGSVGIAGEQTGVYPIDSPGGWQLIGLTPVKMYDPNRAVPILPEAGQYIKFRPIDRKEFEQIQKQVEAGAYECRRYPKKEEQK